MYTRNYILLRPKLACGMPLSYKVNLGTGQKQGFIFASKNLKRKWKEIKLEILDDVFPLVFRKNHFSPCVLSSKHFTDFTYSNFSKTGIGKYK